MLGQNGYQESSTEGTNVDDEVKVDIVRLQELPLQDGMELFGTKDIDHRFDATGSDGPQDAKGKEQERDIETSSCDQQTRYGRKGNQDQTGNVKQDETPHNGPVISDGRIGQEGTQKRRRVGHKDGNGNIRRGSHGRETGIPVGIVHTTQKRYTGKVETVIRKPLQQFHQENKDDGVKHGFEHIEPFFFFFFFFSIVVVVVYDQFQWLLDLTTQVLGWDTLQLGR